MDYADNVKKFYNGYENKLISEFAAGNIRVIEAIKFIKSYLFQIHPKKIIDIGCGIGWTTYEFGKSYPNSVVIGVDISDKLVEIAKIIFEAKNVKFLVKDVTARFQPDDRFDVVTMVDVFEHIPLVSRADFYGSIKSILADNFHLLLTCPSKMHQNYLRSFKREGLQPIDEDVDIEVLQKLAEGIGGELVYFSYKSIWSKNDYLHAAITNDIRYGLPIEKKVNVDVLDKSKRLVMLKEKNIEFSLSERYQLHPYLRVIKDFLQKKF